MGLATRITLVCIAAIAALTVCSAVWAGPASAETLPVTVSVRDFGARGDGVADDSAAIQAALRVAGPKTVVFPAGTYRFSRAMVISGTSIVFQTGAVARLRVDSTSNNYFFASWGSSTARKTGINLTGGTFYGAAYAVVWTSYTDNVTVTGVTSDGPARLIHALDSSHLTVKSCTALNGSIGFHFVRSSYATVSRCTARNMKQDGILFYDRSRYVVADRNVVDQYAVGGELYRAGIHVYGSSNATITNNTVTNGRSDSTGIRFRDSNVFWCADNTITNPGNRGLALARVGDFPGLDGGDGTFIRNKVNQAKVFGIDIYPALSKPVKVIDNVVSYTKTPSGSTYAATALRVFTPKSIVIGNRLQYTDGVALRVDGKGILVARNSVYQPLLLGTGHLVGMRVMGTGHAFVQNSITDTLRHMQVGILVLSGASAVVRSNTVTGATASPISIQGTGLASIGGDSVCPTATFTATISTGSARVSLKGVDNLTGTVAITYRVDSRASVTIPAASGTFTVTGSGTHTIRYSAIDAAGNASAWTVRTITCP